MIIQENDIFNTNAINQRDQAKAYLFKKIMFRANKLTDTIGNTVVNMLVKSANPVVIAKMCGEAMAIPYDLSFAYAKPDENHFLISLSAVSMVEESDEFIEYRRLHEIATRFLANQPNLFLYNQILKVSFFEFDSIVCNTCFKDKDYYVVKEMYDQILDIYTSIRSRGLVNASRIDKIAFLYLVWNKINGIIDEEIDRWSVLTQEIEPGESSYQAAKIMRKHCLSDESINEYISLVRYRQHVMWQPLCSHDLSIEDVKTLVEINQETNISNGWSASENMIYDDIPADQYFRIEDTDDMTADMFEKLVAALYNKQGYTARQTQFSGDQGVDVVAEKGYTTIAIQAKCYSHPVGNSAVQEVVAGKALYNATDAIVITNSKFTTGARQLAEANDIALCDRSMLNTLLLSFPVSYEDLLQVEMTIM